MNGLSGLAKVGGICTERSVSVITVRFWSHWMEKKLMENEMKMKIGVIQNALKLNSYPLKGPTQFLINRKYP